MSKVSIRIMSLFLSAFVAYGVLFTSGAEVSADKDAATGLQYTVTNGKATITGFMAPSGFIGKLFIPATLCEERSVLRNCRLLPST